MNGSDIHSFILVSPQRLSNSSTRSSESSGERWGRTEYPDGFHSHQRGFSSGPVTFPKCTINFIATSQLIKLLRTWGSKQSTWPTSVRIHQRIPFRSGPRKQWDSTMQGSKPKLDASRWWDSHEYFRLQWKNGIFQTRRSLKIRDTKPLTCPLWRYLLRVGIKICYSFPLPL